MLIQRLTIFLYTAIIFFFVCIIALIRKGTLSLKYSLVWLFSGTVIFLIILLPESFKNVMNKLGIIDPLNGLFAICIFLLLVMLLMLTSVISKMNTKIKELVQNLGIAEKRIRELEAKEKMK